MMKNIRLYTIAMVFQQQATPKRNHCLSSSDVKLSSRILEVNAVGLYSFHVICVFCILPEEFRNRESIVRKAPTMAD